MKSLLKMVNFDNVKNQNKSIKREHNKRKNKETEHNQNWLQISDNPDGILITGGKEKQMHYLI